MKINKIFCTLCVGCLFLSSCGGIGGGESATGENIIYAPKDPVTQAPVDGTSSKVDADITQPDVTDTKTPDDTTTAPEIPDDTDSPLTDSTDTSEQVPADTEPPIIYEGERQIITLNDLFPGGESASGIIYSHQSEKIRLFLSYDCQMHLDGGVTVNLLVGLECYDINCGARINTGKIIIDGTSYTFSTDAISHESGTRIYIPFESYIYDVEAGENSCQIDASWLFNGVYGGEKIDTLSLGAVIEWE